MNDGQSSSRKRIGTVVRRFYEAHPFPAFDPADFPTREHLRTRASWFLRLLDRELPTGTRVAEIGCGTGRLSALLSLRNRSVVGVDFCRASLEQAQALKEALGLIGVSYLQGDLFNLPLPEGGFDAVFSMGVLHSTADPRAGFSRIVRLVRPGGLIVIGLYNPYGRIALRFRQRLVARKGVPGDIRTLKRRLGGQLPGVEQETDLEKLRSWYHDQYLHPHELTVTLGQVGRWFRENRVEPLGCFPDPRWFSRFRPKLPWLETRPAHAAHLSGLGAATTQLKWLFTLQGAGGYFVQAGRLPASATGGQSPGLKGPSSDLEGYQGDE